MAELLKNVYNLAFYQKLSSEIQQIHLETDTELFIKKIFCDTWEQKELKDRMRHTTKVLADFLPATFEQAAVSLKKLTQLVLQNPTKGDGFTYLFLADYIEQYGIEYFDISIPLIEYVTQLTSCEFTVRPFIITYPDRMMSVMTKWSKHNNHHVRRLASEGCRPRLPWAMALPDFKKKPNAILPILENLNDDSSEYVRKSVANNLNDITKDNPTIVLQLIKKWKGKSKNTDWIIKHGTRTLLKQGHPEIIAFYNLNQSDDITISDFNINTATVQIGNELEFSFLLANHDTQPQFARLEYAIYYLRQNGSYSKKVFKITEKEIPATASVFINRKQSFRIITTRKFYLGTQKLSIILNGLEKGILEFELE